MQEPCTSGRWTAWNCIHPIRIHTSRKPVGVGRVVCLWMSIRRACKRRGLWTVARSLLSVERWYRLCCHIRPWELARFCNLNYIDTDIWYSCWCDIYIFIPLQQETAAKICWYVLYQRRLTDLWTWISKHINRSLWDLNYCPCLIFKGGFATKFLKLHFLGYVGSDERFYPYVALSIDCK